MNLIEERALIARAALMGDGQAFGRLVREHQGAVRSLLRSLTGGDEATADDLAQETFIRAWQRIGSFRQLSSFATWLHRIAYRLWLDHCKSAAARRETASLDDGWQAPDAPPPAALSDAERQLQDLNDDAAHARERALWLRRAMTQLSDAERTCLALFYLEEMSTRRIAALTGIAEGTVRCHLSRGRAHLKDRLNQTRPDL